MLFGVGMPGSHPGAGAEVEYLDFINAVPERGVPRVENAGLQQINDETHGLSQHLRALSGEKVPQKPPPEPHG